MMEQDPPIGQVKYLQVIPTLNQAAVDLANAQTRKTSLDAQADPAAIVAMLAAESKTAQAVAGLPVTARRRTAKFSASARSWIFKSSRRQA